ncbi:hypothetical protein WA026_020349 [Henosepilachna vigintioctopunctata]|uniref:WH2 domain-containing protein n=1 Tax=Henosepilachna vigintioctopunctata TaxID=420089 RepID=A0AAW1TQ93_9CUCU
MTYKVPLIPPNLRKNETIVQIADSLDYLSRVMDDIMLHIEKRVDIYSSELNCITNRVNSVEQKISQLRQVKNALQVFSSSKYPGTDLDKKYVSIFPPASDITMKRHSVSSKYTLKKDEPLEKLHVYHVQLSKQEPNKMRGLGNIADDVLFVNDLLLYNSGKNVYKEYTISDTLPVSLPSIKNVESKITIGTQPASIADREIFTKVSNQTYFYSPDLGEVPSLDIPIDLPDLPGIANDVKYKEDSHFVIAPSVTLYSTSNPTVSNIAIDDLDSLPEIIPSPPSVEIVKLSPNIEVHEQPIQVVNIETPSNVEENIKIINEPKVQHEQEKLVQKLPVIPDSRASLMEAIRAAGGSKTLKSVKKIESKPTGEKSTGNLMEDLHAKLSMRRKGISGTQKTTESSFDTRGALNLISALIPAPEDTNEESTDVDEEWE